ncbi:MAG: hypothetical protein SF051_05315 [Elusimicrobiota bacterium]|nr:hypothetical protein [Elusimicrobiota bacterium]
MLTPRQKLAVVETALGRKSREIVSKLSISSTTLKRWRRLAAFAAAVETMQREMAAQAVQQFQEARP